MSDVKLPQHGRDHRPGIGSDPIPGISSFAGRMIWGAVFSDGDTLSSGSGDWECTGSPDSGDQSGTNVYRIAFDPAFPNDNISVVLTANNNSPAGDTGLYEYDFGSFFASAYFVELLQRGADAILVAVFDLDGNPVDGTEFMDGGFDFVVVGES